MASRQAAIAPSLIPLTFILDSSCDDGTAGIKLLLQPPILLFLLCQTLRKQATLVMLSFAYIRSHSYILHPVLPSPNRCRDLFLLLLAFVVGIGVTLALKLPTKWQWLGIGAVALLYALPVTWLYWLVFTLEIRPRSPLRNHSAASQSGVDDDVLPPLPDMSDPSVLYENPWAEP